MKPDQMRHAGTALPYLSHEASQNSPHFSFFILQLKAAQSPNVLFIAVDDLNDWVGFMGGYSGQAKTPNLDRLAKMGTAFTNAHTASPVCCPSRVAVLSGQLPTTSGIYSNRHWWKPNAPELITQPAHFRKNGYRTVGAGKIFHHTVGNNPPECWDDFQALRFYDDAFARTRCDQYPFVPDEDVPEGFPFSGIELYSDEVDWAGLDKLEFEFDDACVIEGNLISGRTYRDNGHYLGPWIKLLEEAATRQPVTVEA